MHHCFVYRGHILVSDSRTDLLPPAAVVVVVMEVVAIAVDSVVAGAVDVLLLLLLLDVPTDVGPFLAVAVVVAGGHDTILCSQVKRLESLSASSNTSSRHHRLN